MLFLPDDDKLDAEARRIIEDVVAAEGRCRIAGWREVPVVKDCVGPLARENEPRIVQVRVHVSRSHHFFGRLLWGYCGLAKSEEYQIMELYPGNLEDLLPAAAAGSWRGCSRSSVAPGGVRRGSARGCASCLE